LDLDPHQFADERQDSDLDPHQSDQDPPQFADDKQNVWNMSLQFEHFLVDFFRDRPLLPIGWRIVQI
jgi:hypothetical protein